MLVKNTTYFFLVLILGLVAAGCKKVPTYPKEPAIAFDTLIVKSVTYVDEFATTQKADSLFITIKFQDGDGDLGNNNTAGTGFDFLAELYKKTNGTYIRIDYFDTIPPGYNAYLPQFSPDNVTGPIDGKITNKPPAFLLALPGHPYPAKFPFKKNDTIQFHIRIKDRAGNYSNWVQSSDYIVWKNF